MTMSSMNNINQFGDTTMTKVFVGGLAWETPKETLKDHFDTYGDILEAVIISDKLTGRSKGYGFVTFKDAEAAKRACEDATPVINGRRANCNLASLGARRPRSASTTPILPPPKGSSIVGPRSVSPVPASQVQWYYPTVGTHASPYHHQPQLQTIPYYGYNPTYIATNISYNPKLSYTSGSYMNGHYPQLYSSQAMMGANSSLMTAMYHPAYYHHYHQSQPMGLQAHYYGPATAGPMGSVPTLISKPTTMGPNTGCGNITVGNAEAFRKMVKI